MNGRWATAPCDTNACVEVLEVPDKDMIMVRSTVYDNFTLVFDRQEWINFIQAAKEGRFDVA